MTGAAEPLLLIVDDDDASLAMLDAFLTGEGYRTACAASGTRALAMLDELRPDLVLLDAVMPGLDGFATCRTIKQLPWAANLPVIFMTGLSESSHVVAGLSAGGVDYVTKPLTLDVLSARIRVHLANGLAARSALSALDRSEACLFTATASGRIRWLAPATQRLLDQIDTDGWNALRRAVRDLGDGAAGASTIALTTSPRALTLKRLDPTSPDEWLFRLERSIEGEEPEILQRTFGLTPREADVLLWISRGKSNKDMSEILNISARTVNKHLEQVFIKLGVENRASAAALATRAVMQGR